MKALFFAVSVIAGLWMIEAKGAVAQVDITVPSVPTDTAQPDSQTPPVEPDPVAEPVLPNITPMESGQPGEMPPEPVPPVNSLPEPTPTETPIEEGPPSELAPAPSIEPQPNVPQPSAPQPIEPPTNVPQPSSNSSSINDLYFLTRAKNIARQTAINENGGLMLYRPEASMYGPALESPHTTNPDGTVTFKFYGGAPGAAELTQETEVLVDGDSKATVIYNGPTRSAPGSSAPSADSSNSFALNALDEDTFIARARNLARQAGISANGGLGAYRPEAAMFGPTSGAPVVKNDDGSLTFTFKGGPPGTEELTVETQVKVTKEGQVNVDYNGPVR